MKPLFIKKNGTVSKVSGIIMNLIPSYTMAEYNALTHKPLLWVRTDEDYAQIPSEDVSYGSGSVKDALDNLNNLLIVKTTKTNLTSGFVNISKTGYKPVFAMVTNLPSLVACRGIMWDGNSYYLRLEQWDSNQNWAPYTTQFSCNIVAGYVPA